MRYPDVLTKLRREVDDVLGDEQSVTRAHIQRMPYLHNVLKESRLPFDWKIMAQSY